MVTGDFCPAGRLVHMVKLTGSSPAKVIQVLWNITLKKDLNCTEANHLKEKNYYDPARWFVKHGFTVRSMKESNNWHQVIYKDSNSAAVLTREKKEEYSRTASLISVSLSDNVVRQRR